LILAGMSEDSVEKFFPPVDNIPMITYDEFRKLDIRIGTIVSAVKVQGTDKLLALEISFGTETRQLVAGIAETYQPDHLIGKEIPVLMNLEPRKIRGIVSHGMILAADADGKPVLLHPDSTVPSGSIVR
jgi:methionine--tRNA ligase beta chain